MNLMNNLELTHSALKRLNINFDFIPYTSKRGDTQPSRADGIAPDKPTPWQIIIVLASDFQNE